ncbi:MAG: vitamin B12-dependent ribonucleotide reductase, partial [Planctomycetota bacterium]
MSYNFEPENPFKSQQPELKTALDAAKSDGLRVEHFFATPGVHPFEQDDIEVPVSWSQLAIKVVASKYFYGDVGTGMREHSVKQLVHRVCKMIADHGKRDGYFATDEDAEVFYNEL